MTDSTSDARQRAGALIQQASMAIILIGMIIGFSLLSPPGSFLSIDNAKNILVAASATAILASGMTFLLIAAGLDLSVGAMVVFTSVVGAKTMASWAGGNGSDGDFDYPNLGWAIAGGVVGALLAGLLLGGVNSVLIVRLRIPAFIATLATAGIFLGLSQVWTGGLNVQGVPQPIQKHFGLNSLLGIPYPVVVAAVIVAVLWVILAKTRFGMRTYAIGSSAEAARRAGINVNAHMSILYLTMGVLAGVVGLVEVARFNTATVAGHTETALAAIAAVVIGGTSLFGGRGRMSGTVVGSLIPAVLASGFIIVGIDPFWQNVAIGVVLLIAVFLDQWRRGRERS